MNYKPGKIKYFNYLNFQFVFKKMLVLRKSSFAIVEFESLA